MPDTVSPTSPESVTIVPLWGAYSFVFSTACSALWTASLSLFTAARAEARFASRVAALCLVVLVSAAGVEVGVASAPLDAPLEPPDFDLPPCPEDDFVDPAGAFEGVVVVGVVVVVVGSSVVVVGVVAGDGSVPAAADVARVV